MDRPKEEPIKKTREDAPGKDYEEVEEHPAFGSVTFSRVTGFSGKLFGSHLNRHMGTIRLRVKRCQRRHNLSRDWFFSTDPLIEVEMSYVQFSELLTSINAGEGVPCTIRQMGYEQVPYIPEDMQTEQEKITEGFKEEMGELAGSLDNKLQQVDEILAKKSINQGDRKALRGIIFSAIREVDDSVPFMLRQFGKSTEKIAKAAKAEVDGFLTTALHKLGLETLQKRLTEGENAMMVLPSGDGEEGDSE